MMLQDELPLLLQSNPRRLHSRHLPTDSSLVLAIIYLSVAQVYNDFEGEGVTTGIFTRDYR